MPETALLNNWLFMAMSGGDQDALRPHLHHRELIEGEVLLRSGEAVRMIHFPVSALIANVMAFDTGESLAVSTVGREGVTGLAAFMANGSIGWDAVAHVPGVVWSVPADVMRAQANRSPNLAALLLVATHDNQLEAHSRAICATFHPVLPRLAHWLLTLQERTGLSSFSLTQESFAHLLGVQRTTIVAAMLSLKANGALARGKRANVVIKERAALKAAACSCHSRSPALSRASHGL